MGYTIKFMHGETYSAEDVNNVFSKLTTQGVSLFNDSGSTLSDLNTATASLVSSGIEDAPTALKLIKENDTYKIMPGTAFMHDGSTITVDSDGYLLEGFSVGENYVYIRRREAFNDIVFVVSSETWTENDVPIAIVTIYTNGSYTITDKREFSSAKVKVPTANKYTEHEFSITFNSDANFFMQYDEINIVTPACIACYNGKYVILNEGEQSDVFTVSNDSVSAGIYFVRNGGIIKIYGKPNSSGNPTITFTILFA